MARQWYRPTPADFGMGLGAEAEMLDASELPLDPPRFGRAALVPLTADAFDVYTDAALSTLTTDLLDAVGDPVTQWVTSADFATLGRGPAIQGPDGHEGPLYLSADGVIPYRIEPDSGPLYARVAALEAPKATTDLSDWSATPPTDGQIPVFDSGTGDWVPQDSPIGDLDDLTDVDVAGATAGQVLTKDAGGDWVADTPSFAAAWGDITGKPTTFAPIIGDTSTTAMAGDTVTDYGDLANVPPNLKGILILGPSTPVPGGTAAGTIIVRTVS